MSLFHSLLGSSGFPQLTVSLTSDANTPLNAEFFTVTVVFSRAVVSLSSGDFTLGNSSVGTIYTDDNITFLVTIIPTFTGNVSVQIPNGTVDGLLGGTNTASNTISVTIPTDYLTNILDEWIPQRGGRVNSLATEIDAWYGQKNATQMNAIGSPMPSAGKYTLSGSNYFNLGNATPLGWAGNISFLIRVPVCTTLTNAQEIFWTSTGGDDLRLLAKGASGKIGIFVNGVTTQHATVTWPQDSQTHCIGFSVNFAAGTCKYFVDGTLTATINFTAATGIDYTTTTGFPTFGRFASTNFLSQAFNKVRVYKEAVSDSNMALLTAPANRFYSETIAPTKPVKFYIFGGESIMRGHDDLASQYPAYLQAEMTDILGYKGFNDGFTSSLLGTKPVTYTSPCYKTLYDLRLKYPDYDIYYVVAGFTGASLDPTSNGTNHWLSSLTGNDYENIFTLFRAAMVVLVDVELRTLDSLEFVMAQGINDCDNLTRANNYQANLTAEIPDIIADFVKGAKAVSKVVWAGPHNSLPALSHPYTATVRTAITTVDGSLSELHSFFPDGSTYPKAVDLIHYTPDGTVAIGETFATML